ncbi:uncharacterized protein LOC119108672 isoform X2 [Pollicipes pollicipes]|uniref:uncharacterized protein LOC119108672 isoform X2 n=1 Tax=Pollicipes pollicipes TaxID=41117 RepID=UPI0018857EDE|nr:uncharacterized protein LOC119108672 isoform X2 [Pollicipes pollicipes]
MEFQLGLSPSSNAEDVMCEPQQFLETDWITQGSNQPLSESECPVAGEYEGVIPDTEGQLGAKLYSDCSTPGVMFYSVISRANSSDVYEEREYRCLGTWSEGDVMYTYTQRRDVLSYECFAGRVMADGRVFIGEAGTDESCQRRVDPTRTGMLITKTASCYNTISSSVAPPSSPPSSPSPPTLSPPRPSVAARDRSTDTPSAGRAPTQPYKPITARPGLQSTARSFHTPRSALVVMATLLTLTRL